MADTMVFNRPTDLKLRKVGVDGMEKNATGRNSSENNKEEKQLNSSQQVISKNQKELDEHAESSLSRSERVKVIRELFHERCSLLYHDIIDAIRHGEDPVDETSSEASSPRFPKGDLWSRHGRLTEEAGDLVRKVPEMADDVRYRMQLVQSGISQLASAATKHQDSSASSGDENGSCGSLAQLRRWLQATEDRLSVGWQNFSRASMSELQKMHAEQQVLQKEIEQRGGALVSAVQKQLKVPVEAVSAVGGVNRAGNRNRKRVVVASLQRHWHSLWLRSLEWQYRIEEQIRLIQSGLIQSEESDSDSNEPSAKRRRLGHTKTTGGYLDLYDQEPDIENPDTISEASDTVPFDANEYESIMEAGAEEQLLGIILKLCDASSQVKRRPRICPVD